mgnify:CR=1 FL=1
MKIEKSYKVKKSRINMHLNEKRGINKSGQATIFVIVAIAIVAVIVIAFAFFPGVTERITGQEINPIGFLRSCVDDNIGENIALLARQGGYSNPEGFVLHKGEKVKYLCYTSKYYETCSVQQPMIKTHFEKELQTLSQKKVNDCFQSLKTEYEKRGFSVSSGAVKSNVNIVPNSIRINFETPMTITKEDTKTFDGFSVDIDSEMYDLLFTAQSIIDFESSLGDSETSLYLQYYPNLKIEKEKLGDGTTIYKLSNVITKEEFTFASRSLAWPAGYGTE